MKLKKKNDYKIGTLVSVKRGRYIEPSDKVITPESVDWTIDIPSKSTGIITDEFFEGISGKSFIALVKGKKIIIHCDSICGSY